MCVNGAAVTLSQDLVDQAIELVHIAVNRTITTAGEIILNELLREMMQSATRLNVADIRLGPMVNHGQFWVPSSIMWTDTSTTEQNTHRVWLSLEHYLNQYTDYEIVVVPPFEPLDDFFFAPSVVQSRLNAITPIQMMDRAQEARGGFPATVIRTLEFDYIDISSPDRKFKTFWSVVIYGRAGDNPDAIKDAIVKHILDNTSYPRQRWEQIFPDIFKRTEYVLAPLWNQYSATASQLRHGIYSPLIPVTGVVVEHLIAAVPEYPQDHIRQNTITMPFIYRSLAIPTIGNIENRDGKFLITDYFPDYMAIPTSDTDFNRVSTMTQEWIYKVHEAILQAEEWFDGYDLRPGFYRIERDSKFFVGFTYENVQYLILTKTSTPE